MFAEVFIITKKHQFCFSMIQCLRDTSESIILYQAFRKMHMVSDAIGVTLHIAYFY
jgi:hypothetical protein